MAETIVTETFVVPVKQGLHLRPAEQLARLAGQYASAIGLVYQSQRVDAKSIMEMLTLGAAGGASIVIEARGPDAQQAVAAIMDLVAKNFNEGPESSEAMKG